jgi:ferredoxin-NADP reductase
MSSSETLSLRVKSIVWEAPGILSYELRRPEGGALPPFTPGAHIDLQLSNGLVRSYSLVGKPAERDRYVVAIQKDRASRGGSSWIHDNVHAGDLLRVGMPRNNFPLDEAAPHSVLIAGGIGITPILAMTRRLRELGRPWTLHYCARTEAQAAFVAEARALAEEGGVVYLNFDEAPGGTMLDLAGVVAAAPAGAHLYCCGPLPMLAAFEAAAANVSPERVHVEYFTAKDAPDTSGGFKVVLAKSGTEVMVREGQTILDAVQEAGVDVPHSCLEGVCGTCETRVIEGVPDHRDLVLTASEQASGRTMMICCSGAKSERLVLDL